MKFIKIFQFFFSVLDPSNIMGIFLKIFFQIFFMNTLQRGLSPLFTRQNVTYGRGDTGEGGVSPPIGGNQGGCMSYCLVF